MCCGIKINGKKSAQVVMDTKELVEGCDPGYAEILKWGLWLWPVDIDCNVMTTCWSKNWCFYCIIRSLKNDKRWPNWRNEITKEKLIKNKLIADIFNQLKNQLKNQQDSKNKSKNWKSHKKSLELFWENWKKWIWVNWISQHNWHTIKSIQDKYSEANDQCSEVIKKIDMKDEELSTQQKGLEHVKLVRGMFVESVIKPSINEVTQELNILTEKYIDDVSTWIDQTKSLKEKLQNSKTELKAKVDSADTNVLYEIIQKHEKADEYLNQKVAIAASLNPLLNVESEDFENFYIVKTFLEDEKSNDDESFVWNTVETLEVEMSNTDEKVMVKISSSQGDHTDHHVIKLTRPDAKDSKPKIFFHKKGEQMELDITEFWKITKLKSKCVVETNLDILKVDGEQSNHLGQLVTGIIDVMEKAAMKVKKNFETLIPKMLNQDPEAN